MSTILKINKLTREIERLSGIDLTNFSLAETNNFRYVVIGDTDEIQTRGFSVGPGDDKKSAIIVDGLTILPSDGNQKRSVSFPPTADQALSGQLYGAFNPNELLFQTTVLPVVQNYYLVNGISQAAYNPVVATIGFTAGDTFGFVGRRCAEFKGTPSDSAGQAAATVVLPIEIDSTHLNHFLISGFMYLSTTPSTNYDPVVVGVVNNITAGTTADAWIVDIDSDTIKRVRFSWATTNDSVSGFPRSLYVTPTYGITLNQWHHWAVAYSNAGGSAEVSSYWNGTRTSYSNSGFSGSFRNNANNLVSVGADRGGRYPYNGYLSHVMISGGTATKALRGFTHGVTAPVPDQYGVQAGKYTFAAMSMNGPLGYSLFPCDLKNRVVSVCDGDFDGTLYVSGTRLETDSLYRTAMGLSAFSGVCGGHSSSAGVTGNSYVFGYETGSCLNVSSVENLLGLSGSKQVAKNRLELSYGVLSNTLLVGFCANPAPMSNFFSTHPTGFSGSTFSFLLNASNINALSTISAGVSGSTAAFYFPDADGTVHTMSASAITALDKDIKNYFAGVYTEYNSVLSQINGATTKEALSSISGFTSESFTQKLAVFSVDDKSVFLESEKMLVGDFKRAEEVAVLGRYENKRGPKPAEKGGIPSVGEA
jgi:hypothetical protein